MKIDPNGNMGNIQNIAQQSSPSKTPVASVITNSKPTGSNDGRGNSQQEIGELLGAQFDSNLSEKLKNPEMKEEFDNVLDYANKLLFNDNSVLKFSRHEATGTTLVKLIDSQTDEVLREFPPEKILNIIAGIWEVAGLVVNKKA